MVLSPEEKAEEAAVAAMVAEAVVAFKYLRMRYPSIPPGSPWAYLAMECESIAKEKGPGGPECQPTRATRLPAGGE